MAYLSKDPSMDPTYRGPAPTPASVRSRSYLSTQSPYRVASLAAYDPEFANSFASEEMETILSGLDPVALGPDGEELANRDTNRTPLLAHLDGGMEDEIAALQTHLDLMTQAKARKDAKRGKRAAPDAADQLLAYGLRVLLGKISRTMGQHRHPRVMISFNGLTLRARVPEGSDVIPTYGRALWKLATLWRRPKYQERVVLNNLTGSFRPGLTTLVLGPPRSGKSALMKTIAGRVRLTRHTTLEGTIEFGGRVLDPKDKNGIKIFKLVGYVPQTDEHVPTLTVRETMQFAHASSAKVALKYLKADGYSDKQVAELSLLDDMVPEATMAILGIRHVGDTVVGNEGLRGISGGQRKRLTTGEVLVTKNPVLLADEISTGLDSATTYDICNAFKAFAEVMGRTIVVSLLQPTPETFATFDEVLVMSAGHIAYHGPGDAVLPYFESLGFACPAAKDTAEFLQEVTLPRGIQKYRRTDGRKAWFTVETPEDFGPAWQSSELFRKRQEEDAVLYAQSKQSLDSLPPEGFVHHKLTSNYTTSLPRSMWLCMKRQVVLTLRNKQNTVGRFVQVVIMGLILGSLFFQTATSNYNAFYSVLYFSMLFISLSGFALIPAITADKRVIYRQTSAHFYSSMPYSIAVHLLDIPLSFIEVLLFVAIVYWMVGLSATVVDFFAFTLTIFLVKLAMGALFRVIAGVAPSGAVAQAIASVVLMVFILHTGFFLSESNVKPWWIWAYWINCLQYGMTSLSLIQFYSATYSGLLDPSKPSLGTLGLYYLNSKQMPTDLNRLWLGWIFNTGFFCLMTILFGVVLRHVRWPEKFPAAPPPPTEGITVEETAPMPFTPCTLAWENVCYDVDIPGKRGPEAKLGLRLLEGVNGFARPGTMTALMGSSGAGKTTLLDVLAGRKNTGKVTGRILLNGREADPITFSRFAGYVEQMDVHSPSATVAEALRFSALLRLPREVPTATKEVFVWQVIAMLNMTQFANSQIGTRGNGLSVEQVKRVTVGVEMAANPAVLFLDEPTSGLDSMAADIVMDALKAVAASGRTLICTIHQPSGYLFQMFQSLLLLMRGGKTVFFGETGDHSAALIAYFNGIPGAPSHDGRQNPATWMLDVIGTEGIDFPAEYQSSELYSKNAARLQDALQVTGEELSGGHLYQASIVTQFVQLYIKWLRVSYRAAGYNMARTLTSVIIALIMGSIFFRLKMNDEQTVFSLVGIEYMSFIFMGVMFANTIQGLVAVERAVFYRERAAHMYHPILLDVVAGLSEIPYVTLNTMLFTAIFYWMVGLNPDVGLFFIWYLVFWIYILSFTLFGWLMGCLLPGPELATVLVSLLTSLSGLMSGFMLPKLEIPWWWRWLYYGIPLTYAIQPTISTQFYCAAAEANPNNYGDCPAISVTNTNGVTSMVAVWVYVRDYFDLVYGARWMYIGILVAFLAMIRIASGLTLQYVNHAKR